ncbi:MAG: membrane protein YczE [Acidimicrobiales bacterium]
MLASRAPLSTATSVRPLVGRLVRLLVGLACCGTGLGLMVVAEMGLGPWEVLHQGLSERSGLPIGRTGILVGLAVLAAWLPLRLRPGLGTVCNVILIGLVIDVVVGAFDRPATAAARVALMLGGVGVIGLGSGLYIGAGFGAGPRDGLMTGLVSRGAGSVRVVRTAIELSVLALGWGLGGTVGVGTIVFALCIGPLVQGALRRFGVGPVPAEVTAAAE